MLCKQDLSLFTRCHSVELANGQDIIYLIAQIFAFDVEHIHGKFAGESSK